ncbi:MAG: MEDS domain-containing protein [Alphaproteobacteria bacterium]|nr:MEDS domain-containing protein [Alphaproteobacteria bacterium]
MTGMATNNGKRRAQQRSIALDWDGPERSLRDTGISVVGRIPWGTHLCMFYETRQDAIDAVVSYMTPAAQANEYCIWVVPDSLGTKHAEDAARRWLPDFASRQPKGLEIVAAKDWYLENGCFDWHKSLDNCYRCIDRALAKGFDGVRACGKPLLRQMQGWREIAEYERRLEASMAGHPIVLLCMYSTKECSPEDVLDVARAHQCVIARRDGEWQFLEAPGNLEAKREIELLNGDRGVLPPDIAAGGIFTERERLVLAQIAKGASSKEAARVLGISPRTVDFHRANMMQKAGAKNTADLMRKVLGTR